MMYDVWVKKNTTTVFTQHFLYEAKPYISEQYRLAKNSNRQTADKLELMASTEPLREQAMT